jgi:integrase/ribosomal protein L40E
MNGFGLYNYPRRLELAIANLSKDQTVCEENKKGIVSFSKGRLAKGSGHGRVTKVVYGLRLLARMLKKPFAEATKDDLVTLVGEFESNPDYSEYTRLDYKIILKMFFKWLKGNDEVFPPEINWLKPKLKNEKHKLPEDLLTEDEVIRLVNATDQPRDRAFILVLYESGCRIGELLSLNMGNVQFDQYGAVLRVTGKTGDRRVRIISSAPALATWINLYGRAQDPKAPLWPPRSTCKKTRNPIQCLDHRSVYKLLLKLAEKAGIKKHVHPHLFRHSRATALASKLTEAQMKEHFGWVQGSEMAATYVHLSGRDVDSTLLQMYSLKDVPVQKEVKLDIRICSRCKEKNSPTQSFCGKCGNPFDEKILLTDPNKKANDLMNVLIEDEEVKNLLLKKIVEKGLDKTFF